MLTSARSVGQEEHISRSKNLVLRLLHQCCACSRGWLCTGAAAVSQTECPFYSCGLWLSEGKSSRKHLLQRFWAPQWALPGNLTLSFWQPHRDDDCMPSFLPLLPTGLRVGKQTLLLFLILLLPDGSSCLISVPVPMWVTSGGLPTGKGHTYPPECPVARGESHGQWLSESLSFCISFTLFDWRLRSQERSSEGSRQHFFSVHRQTAMGADVVSECGKANFKKSSRRNKGFSKAGNHKWK